MFLHPIIGSYIISSFFDGNTFKDDPICRYLFIDGIMERIVAT